MRTKLIVVLAGVFVAVTAAPAVPEGVAAPRDGVTRREIRIGLHAPLTGAAPVSSHSAQDGSSVYWKWLRERGEKIHRRYVEAVLKNDNYNPSQAVAVCKEMVEKDRVFTPSGWSSTP